MLWLASKFNEEIADREVARASEIEDELDYISRQLGHLEVTEELPNAGVPSDHLINCAMEVHSTVMVYLAILIRYESKVGGVVGMPKKSPFVIDFVGKVVNSFVRGNEDREAATAGLETAIDDFNNAFFVYAHRVNLKTYTHVQGFHPFRMQLRLQTSEINCYRMQKRLWFLPSSANSLSRTTKTRTLSVAKNYAKPSTKSWSQ